MEAATSREFEGMTPDSKISEYVAPKFDPDFVRPGFLSELECHFPCGGGRKKKRHLMLDENDDSNDV